MAPNIAPITEPTSDAVLRLDDLLPAWLAADVCAGEALEWMAADVIPGEALELFRPDIVGEGEAAAKLVCALSVVDVAGVLRGKVNMFSSASAVKMPPEEPQPYQTVSPLLNSSFQPEGAAESLYNHELRSQQGSEYRSRIIVKVSHEPAKRPFLTCDRRIVVFLSCDGRLAQGTAEQDSRR